MHVEEIRAWFTKKIPGPIQKQFKRSLLAKRFNYLLYRLDELRFRLFHDPHTNDELQMETARLRYSWSTFTNEYLSYRHGQDLEHPSRKKMNEIIGILSGKYHSMRANPKLLEIPFGMGTDYEHYFSKMPLDYTGIELNPKQVALTRRRLNKGYFIIGNILSIEAPDRNYDMVYCRHIFEHLSLNAMDVALLETIRVARQDLIFVFFNMAEVPEHEERPVRQYYLNLLSRARVQQRLLSFPRVTEVNMIQTPQENGFKLNVLFHVRLTS